MSVGRRVLSVAVAGMGAAGWPVVRWLDGDQPGLCLIAVAARDGRKAEEKLSKLENVPSILPIEQLPCSADVVVEALPPKLFRAVAEPTIHHGKTLVALTATGLVEHWDIVELAQETGARIIVPSGGLLGLDAVAAAAMGQSAVVTMRTHKPPRSLKTASFVIEQGIDLDTQQNPLCLYRGSVADAASKFPANVNVAVALALAGVGLKKTRYELWADPAVTRNTHEVEVDADSTRIKMTIENVPSVENPATGKLTSLSVMATLVGLVSTLRVRT